MSKLLLVFVVFFAVIAVACGGGGGEPGNGGGSTPQPSESVTPLEVNISDSGLQPQTFDIIAGSKYKFVVNNTGTKSRTFVATRWVINVTVPPGGKGESGPFSDAEVGAQADCHEQSRAIRTEWKCVVNIKAG
ncbi:MAG: hypothetical protein HY681_09910 [Chloroflexi bacterium]|nr:hypothetical protein [Chloroflexota bacterium]